MLVGLEQVLDVSKTFNLENLGLFLDHFSVNGKEHKISVGCTLYGLHATYNSGISVYVNVRPSIVSRLESTI